jgi:hypothetical protein
MKVDGQCQCGAIRFEAEVDPEKVSICHCTDCQQFSGSPFRGSVPAPAATFRITAGKPATYIKTAESGARRLQAFCGNCGSPIYAAAPENTPTYNLRLGVVNQRAQLPPRKQIWTKSALDWAQDVHDLPGVEKG